MASNCYSCIMDRGKFEADLCIKSELEKTEALEELLDYMAAHKRGVPALVGTRREYIIKKKSGNRDPYHDLKAESNVVARRILPVAQEYYDSSSDKFESIIRIAAAANSMEFGVKGHNFDNQSFESVFQETLKEQLNGDLDVVKRYLGAFDNIYYLTDNAGEVVFDLMVVDYLEKMGKRVIMGPKADPILNDVTISELSEMSDKEIVATGGVVGIDLDRINPKAKELLFDEKWLIIAKGMGNYETMTEFDSMLHGRLIYIMRAKCEPVALNLGVPRGTLVVKPI